jgi:hypothetical protein
MLLSVCASSSSQLHQYRRSSSSSSSFAHHSPSPLISLISHIAHLSSLDLEPPLSDGRRRRNADGTVAHTRTASGLRAHHAYMYKCIHMLCTYTCYPSSWLMWHHEVAVIALSAACSHRRRSRHIRTRHSIHARPYDRLISCTSHVARHGSPHSHAHNIAKKSKARVQHRSRGAMWLQRKVTRRAGCGTGGQSQAEATAKGEEASQSSTNGRDGTGTSRRECYPFSRHGIRNISRC